MVPVRSPSAAAMAVATPGDGAAAPNAGSSASSRRTRSAIGVSGVPDITSPRAGLKGCGCRSCGEGPGDPAAARDVDDRLPRAPHQQPARAVAVDEHPQDEMVAPGPALQVDQVEG